MSTCKIYKLDAFFSYNPKILYCCKDTFKSTFGGIFSIVHVMVLLGVFIPLLKNMIQNERKMIQDFPLFYSNKSNQEIYRNLTLSIQIIDTQNGNPILFDQTVFTASLRSKIVNSENRMYNLPKISCSNSIQLNLINANQEYGFSMDNMTLFRNFSHFNFFEITFTKCSNITSDGVTQDVEPCKPLHSINQIILNSMIQFKMRLEYYDFITSTNTFYTKVFNTASNSKMLFAPDTQLIYLTPAIYMKDTNPFIYSTLEPISGDFLDYEATYIDSSGDDDNHSSFHTIFLLSNFYQMTEIMQEKILYTQFPAIVCIFHVIREIMNYLYQHIQKILFRNDFDNIIEQKSGKLLDDFCEDDRKGMLNVNGSGSNMICNISNIQDGQVNNNLPLQDEGKMNNNCINNQDSKTNNKSSSFIKHNLGVCIEDSMTHFQINCPNIKEQAQPQEKNEMIKFIPGAKFSFQDPLNVVNNKNSSLADGAQCLKNPEALDNDNKGSRIFIYSKEVEVMKSEKRLITKRKNSRCGKIYFCLIRACKNRSDLTKSRKKEKIRECILKFTSLEEISYSLLSLENLISKIHQVFDAAKDKDFSPISQFLNQNPFDLQNSNILPIK